MGRQRQPFDRLRTGLFSDGLRSYTYDHANRLTSVTSGTLTTEFVYNGVGDRISKTVDGVTTDYVLDPAAGLTQVLVESTGGESTSYLYGHDLLAQYDSGTWAYHVDDGLGSVRGLANPAGQVVQSYSFSPFGVPLGDSGGEPYGFTGEQWDAEVELLYLRARFYDPAPGRFLSKDPWQGLRTQPRTLNKYVYATNNPITKVDPSGFCSQRGWNDSSGLFTEQNCDRIESGDLDFTKQWYNDFADYVEKDLPQTAAHFRHFLSGAGGELQLPESFVRDDILGIDRLERSINGLIKWYVRQHIDELKPCVQTPVGPDIYARGFTPRYAQAHPIGAFIFGTSELDVAGSLGSFRIDVELTGNLHRLSSWEGKWRGQTDANLQAHVVVLDIYDWHKGLDVEYEGNSIPDDWPQSLMDNGLAAPFLVRGDYTYNVKETLSKPIFGVGNSPPSPWVEASCIGSQFEITSLVGGTSKVDYCGNPMK